MRLTKTFGRDQNATDEIILNFYRQTFYKDADAYQLTVVKSPENLAGGAFRSDIEQFLNDFHQLFAGRLADQQFFYGTDLGADESASENLAELGERLYQLLPETFRQDFPLLLQRIFERGRNIQITLEATAGDRADRLLNLPWELLFNGAANAFMARTPRVIIVRRLLDIPRRASFGLELPFNLLHVIADKSPTQPDDRRQDSPNTGYVIEQSLLDTERSTIEQAVVPGEYQRIENTGSIEQLRESLETAQSHIIHFLGHGALNPFEIDEEKYNTDVPARGYLRFVAEDGSSQWITGERLQLLLQEAASIQIVVLNACQGSATVESSRATSSIALELIYNGLPYVVAMQGPILQDAAGHFIQAFYSAIQGGNDIELAVARGRAEIANHMPETLDWCLPVLYTNVGIQEPEQLRSVVDTLWHQASALPTQQRIGTSLIWFGVLQLLVNGLLLMSGHRVEPPNVALFPWVVILLPLLSIGMGVYAARIVGQQHQGKMSPTLNTVLFTRVIGSSLVGVGLPVIFSWLALRLFIAVGFWSNLSLTAQTILLLILFTPAILIGLSQAIGHGRSFLSNANIDFQGTFWQETVFSFVGILMTVGVPWLLFSYLHQGSDMLWTDLLLGIFFIFLGWVVMRSQDVIEKWWFSKTSYLDHWNQED